MIKLLLRLCGMKTLLIGINSKYIHPNIAIRLLKANTIYDVDIMEFNIKDNINKIYNYIIDNGYNVVAFSCYIWNIELIKELLLLLKDKNKNARDIYSIIMNKHLLMSVECRTSHKEMTDADMVKIITKTIKERAEEAENYKKVGNAEKANNIAEQQAILEKYLPKMKLFINIDHIF